jgi:Cdc6-like AAA superfamily ATPase
MHFEPYQVSEITSIVKERMCRLKSHPFNENSFGIPLSNLLSDAAVEMLSRKVYTNGGDARDALVKCRRLLQNLSTEGCLRMYFIFFCNILSLF